jgi:hypothetical protein
VWTFKFNVFFQNQSRTSIIDPKYFYIANTCIVQK